MSGRLKIDFDSESLQRFVDSVPVAVVVHDMKGQIIETNKITENYTFYSREELLAMSVKDIDPFSGLKQDLEILWENLLSGGSEEIESMHLRKDKSKYYAQINISAVKINGKPHIMAVIHDITRFKDVENALIDSERIFNYARDMICIVGLDGYFKTLNPSWTATLGWSMEELKSKPWLEFVHPDDREACLKRKNKIVENNEMLQFENRYVCKNGTYKWLSWSCYPFPDEEVLYGIARDVTEKKMFQEEAIRHEKLESLGILAGGIAHDFNNLLFSLYGNVEMAKSNVEDSEKVKRYLENAAASFNTAKSLADQLLTFSKGGDPIKKTGDIGECVIKHCTFALSGSNVLCEYDIDPELKPVDYDPDQISQVIQNIVLNSLQSMPDGGIIGVSVHSVNLEKGEFVRISIADSGSGMPTELLKNIFDPFFTTKKSGSGLGLSTSYSIVQKHDGFIEVESEEGVGTVFHIYLPVSDKMLKSKKENQKKVVKNVSEKVCRVLIMDDQKSVRAIIKDMLEHMGCRVLEATDGEQAIAITKEVKEKNESLDCAILDLTIPGGLGGKEAVSEILKIIPNLPVFASSGYSSNPVMSEPGKYGFLASLKKPFSFKEISNIVKKLIGEKS